MSWKIGDIYWHRETGKPFVVDSFFDAPSITMREAGGGEQIGGAHNSPNIRAFDSLDQCCEEVLRSMVRRLTALVEQARKDKERLLDQLFEIHTRFGQMVIQLNQLQMAAQVSFPNPQSEIRNPQSP
jgi:hypothetical protein